MRVSRFLAATILIATAVVLSGDCHRVLLSARAAEVSSTRAQPSLSGKKITPECKKSIADGTKWLVRAIRSDGGVGPDLKTPPELGCTAMVGLALLSQGNTPDAGPHSRRDRSSRWPLLLGCFALSCSLHENSARGARNLRGNRT